MGVTTIKQIDLLLFRPLLDIRIILICENCHKIYIKEQVNINYVYIIKLVRQLIHKKKKLPTCIKYNIYVQLF